MPHVFTNGIATFYEESGNGPVVVLIHGHGADLSLWQYQAPALVEAGFRVVCYDVRGHGRSHVPPHGYTWDNYATDLCDLLDRLNVERPASEPLGVERVHIVGLSMGGGIALKFALDHPDRVLSLTLVDSTLPGFTYSEETSARVKQLVEAIQGGLDVQAAFEKLWLTHPFFDGIRHKPERFQIVRDAMARFGAREYQPEYEEPDGRQTPDLAVRLGEVRAPALVIVGEHDIEDFRQIADILAENIAGARLLVMKDTWHLPPLEQPERFNSELIRFLRESQETAGE